MRGRIHGGQPDGTFSAPENGECHLFVCSSPTVRYGEFDTTNDATHRYMDGDAIDSSRIRCRDYFVATGRVSTCACLEDNAPCRPISNACKRNVCFAPNIRYGRYDPADWTETTHNDDLDIAKVTCNPGYGHNPSISDIRCNCPVDGVSCEEISDICVENRCGPVNVEASGVVAGVVGSCDGGGVISDGPTCTFECETGFYIRDGEDTIACNIDDGLWPSHPVCGEVCPVVASVADTVTPGANCDGGPVTGDPTCTLRCAAGFAFGTAKRVPRSAANERRDGGTPFLPAKHSHASLRKYLTRIAHLTDPSLVSPGTLSRFNVIKDTMGEEAVCQPDGSFVAPACEAVECEPSQIRFSDHSTIGSVVGRTGDTVTVTCDEGYEGGGDVQCTPEGRFTRAVCRPNPCLPTEILNSNRELDGSIVGFTGDVVEIECDTGYKTESGDATGEVTCQTSGSFTTLRCVPQPCDDAQIDNSIEYSEAASIRGRTGDVVSIVCEEGFSGDGDAVCTPSGRFRLPQCVPLPCAPSQVNFSEYASVGSITGTTHDEIEISCRDGYEGGGSVVCLTSGTFTSVSCEAVPCADASVAFSDHDDLETSPIAGSTGDAVLVECAGILGAEPHVCPPEDLRRLSARRIRADRPKSSLKFCDSRIDRGFDRGYCGRRLRRRILWKRYRDVLAERVVRSRDMRGQ